MGLFTGIGVALSPLIAEVDQKFAKIFLLTNLIAASVNGLICLLRRDETPRLTQSFLCSLVGNAVFVPSIKKYFELENYKHGEVMLRSTVVIVSLMNTLLYQQALIEFENKRQSIMDCVINMYMNFQNNVMKTIVLGAMVGCPLFLLSLLAGDKTKK